MFYFLTAVEQLFSHVKKKKPLCVCASALTLHTHTSTLLTEVYLFLCLIMISFFTSTFNFHGWWIFFCCSSSSSRLSSLSLSRWVEIIYFDLPDKQNTSDEANRIRGMRICNSHEMFRVSINITFWPKWQTTKQKVNAHTHTYLIDFRRKKS